MRLWWEVARRGFRRYATYRWATFAGVFTNTVFGFIRAYVFIAMFGIVGSVGNYDLTDALTYTFASQGFLMPLYIWGWQEIAETVQSGQIATDLYRPFDYQLYWLSQDLGRACYHALLRGIAPFVIGAAFFHLRVPTSAITWVFFVVSVGLAVSISFALRFMVNLAAFWFFDVRGINNVAATIWTLLSGATMPLALFPEAVRGIVHLLPFAGMLELPMNVFLERVTHAEMLGIVAIQLTWTIVLLACGRLVLAAATRKLVVQGG